MKQFMPDVSPQERIRLLQENCDKQETTTYMRDLTQEELDLKRETLVDNLIKTSKSFISNAFTCHTHTTFIV